VDRHIRIVQHLEQVLESCHMMLKMKETSNFYYSIYVQKKKVLKHCLVGAVSYL